MAGVGWTKTLGHKSPPQRSTRRLVVGHRPDPRRAVHILCALSRALHFPSLVGLAKPRSDVPAQC